MFFPANVDALIEQAIRTLKAIERYYNKEANRP